MNIYEKLTKLQTELKAPKDLYNSFGKYKYRNTESILEAVKPLLKELQLAQLITDEIVQVGDRFYIKATVTLINIEKPGEVVNVNALAREPEIKKGMDASQITGTSSSYARKYALNGLYAIDDTKDSDFTNTDGGTSEKIEKPTAKELQDLFILSGSNKELMQQALERLGMKSSKDITKDNLFKVEAIVKEMLEA